MNSPAMAQTRVSQRPSFLANLARNRGFIACVALLSVLTLGFQVLTRKIQVRKLEVPLKRQLDQLDRNALTPFELVRPYDPIKSEMLDALGTKEYVQWLLKDAGIREELPEKYIHLFVTYYTGKPDQVPHVPEKCYLAQNNQLVSEEYEEMPIPALGKDFTVPVKVLEFQGSHLLERRNTVVMYTFHANGQFCRDRREVQSTVGNPFAKHAYFSKLELTFGSAEQAPDRQKAIAAGRRFLQVVVPVLLRDHWPDWDAVVRSENAPASAAEKASK